MKYKVSYKIYYANNSYIPRTTTVDAPSVEAARQQIQDEEYTGDHGVPIVTFSFVSIEAGE